MWINKLSSVLIKQLQFECFLFSYFWKSLECCVLPCFVSKTSWSDINSCPCNSSDHHAHGHAVCINISLNEAIVPVCSKTKIQDSAASMLAGNIILKIESVHREEVEQLKANRRNIHTSLLTDSLPKSIWPEQTEHPAMTARMCNSFLNSS